MVIGRRLVSLFFHLLELCCSLVFPFDGVGLGNTFGGGDMLNASSPVSYAIPLLPSFLFLWLPFSLSCGFCLEWLENSFADCNFLRCREQFCLL